jgi:Pectate lyase
MKKQVGKLMLLAAVVAVGSVTTSCKKKGCTDPDAINYSEEAKKDDGSCEYAPVVNEEVLTGFITSNKTLTADKIWVLDGKVVVNAGVTLTINAGTIIKGKEGTGTLASALIIPKGAKIMANGTAASPIIFTSILDNIAIGQTTGTNLTKADKGKWGGLLILGNAPISAADGDVLSQIEGIPATETYGAYGGSDAADNSGVLNYVSIRHGGALIGAGNEINGLTLGGVGNGTTITNIEVVANLDDGVECFGGSVNITNVVVGYVGDDALDVDQNYDGTITNFIVIQDVDSDKGLEIDGTEGTTYTTGTFALVNGKVYSKDGGGRPGDFKDKAQGTVTNLKTEGYTTGTIKVRASYQSACSAVKTDACSNLIAATPKLSFTGCAIPGVEVYTTSTDGGTPAVTCTVFSSDQTAASAAVVNSTSTGADQSAFGWTWTSVKNLF